MKDRVSRNPGAYKAMIPAGGMEALQNGEEFEIFLKRDDDPEVEGTPYNKESVVPDDVAEAVCPRIEDPTPADVFRELDTHAKLLDSAVDDIKETLENLDTPGGGVSGDSVSKEYVDNNLLALLGPFGNCGGFWSTNGLNAQTGEVISGYGTIVLSNGYVPIPVTKIRSNDSDYVFAVFGYSSGGDYLGVWDGSKFVKGEKTWFSELDLADIDWDPYFSYRYRIELQHIEGPESFETELDQFYIIQFYTNLAYDVEKVQLDVGNIATALDGIIAIQNELIGGDGV